MDPNVTLREIREAVAEFNDTSKSLASRNISLETMAEKFDVLDAWLSSGGFLPHSWDLAIAKRTVESNPVEFTWPDHEEIWCERCAKGNHYFFDQNGRPVENCNCCGKEKS